MNDVITQQEPASFEVALKELEGIVKQLETGEAKLEEALELFERGVKLTRFCTQKLDEAEKKIDMLVKDSQGQYKAVPFEPEK
jgi:exodeoxyribonuclease VII small subunit